MGDILVKELLSMGATFISCYILGGYEEEFYQSLGFKLNKGMLAYYIDKRPCLIGTEQWRVILTYIALRLYQKILL